MPVGGSAGDFGLFNASCTLMPLGIKSMVVLNFRSMAQAFFAVHVSQADDFDNMIKQSFGWFRKEIVFSRRRKRLSFCEEDFTIWVWMQELSIYRSRDRIL